MQAYVQLEWWQDVFDYIANHGLAGALEGAHVAPLMRIDEGRAAALLVDRVAQVPPRVVVPALQVGVRWPHWEHRASSIAAQEQALACLPPLSLLVHQCHVD